MKSIFPGASKVALTLDVTTKRRVIHVKCVSDVFAQEFSWSVSWGCISTVCSSGGMFYDPAVSMDLINYMYQQKHWLLALSFIVTFNVINFIKFKVPRKHRLSIPFPKNIAFPLWACALLYQGLLASSKSLNLKIKIWGPEIIAFEKLSGSLKKELDKRKWQSIEKELKSIWCHLLLVLF